MSQYYRFYGKVSVFIAHSRQNTNTNGVLFFPSLLALKYQQLKNLLKIIKTIYFQLVFFFSKKIQYCLMCWRPKTQKSSLGKLQWLCQHSIYLLCATNINSEIFVLSLDSAQVDWLAVWIINRKETNKRNVLSVRKKKSGYFPNRKANILGV